MTRGRAVGLAIGAAWLAACANTRDVYVGSDIPNALAADASSPSNTAGASESGNTAGASESGNTAGASESGNTAGASEPSGPVTLPPAAGSPSGAPDAGQSSGPVPPAGPASCATGRADCDGDPQTGCEVDTATDPLHCGGCEQACHANGTGAASAACVGGECRLRCQFAPIMGDCDGDPDNGCETDLFHDVNNCGTCGMRCSGCVDSRCL